jgi:Zn-dependent protease
LSSMIYDGAILYACLLFSLCVHEAAHAATANWCGDPSARLLGRVTLNPLVHIDILGTVVLPLMLIFGGGGRLFGWAKPVPFNPVNLKNIRRDPVLIALAGPLSNLLIVLVVMLALRIVFLVVGVAALEGSPVWDLARGLIYINLVLMCFNLIPIPPLDGHHVLFYFLPPGGQRVMASIGPFGLLIVIVVGFRFLGLPIIILFNAAIRLALWGAS